MSQRVRRTPPTVPAGPVTIDLVVTLVLTAVALVGLDDSYNSRAYLVTGMIGAAAIAAWALLCTVQAFSGGAFLLVASVAFPVLGATLVLHDFSWLGFPSAKSVAELLTAAITAPPEFLTTIPPVDAEGVVLAIPYVVGFLLGGSAVWFALRTKRPMLPVVPLVLAMVLCIVLGTERPIALLVRAAVFAMLAVLWVSLRAARLRTAVHAERGRTLRVLCAAALAVGTVALSSLLLPSVPSEARVVLRGRVGSGQDVSQLDNPLAGFRKFTDQPTGTPDNVADTKLLKVTGLPRRDVLRIVALDTYDGTTWVAGNRTVEGDSASLFQRIGEDVGARRHGRQVRVSVEVKQPWTSSWLPLAGQLTGITFDFLDGRAQRKDVRYNVATETGMVVGGLQGGDDYTFSAIVPDLRLTKSMAPYGTGEPVQSSGAFLDRYLHPWKVSGLQPMAQVISLAKYLRINGRFSDGARSSERRYLPGHSQSRLGTGFIGARSIVGDDEQYAAFMALAANRLGVPARVVVGARPDSVGWVRGRNVRAWVELRVFDGTWRSLPAGSFMSHKPPKRTDDPQSPSSFVQSTTRQDEPRQQPPTQGHQPAAPGPNTGNGAPGGHVAWLTPLSVVTLGLVPGLKWLRRRHRRRAARPADRIVRGWTEVLDLARDLAREVPEGLPRTEQARLLGLSIELARLADVRVFARDEPTKAEAAEFWRAVSVERRRFASQARVVRRVVAVWSPRSLLHSLSVRQRHARSPGWLWTRRAVG
ncbi:MAG: hypothetical protein JWR85_1197 [Marmoricola sp.]|nr:hypothetical protein [Marmoricola sp.]